MALKFSVLASSSAGNASWIQAEDFGVLLDIGLGPKKLEACFAELGLSWTQVRAVLLTHMHSDHWNDASLKYMAEMNIPLYCHPDHHRTLESSSTAYTTLVAKNLIFAYEPEIPLDLAPNLTCTPFAVRHDSGATCGFRLDGPRDLFGEPTSLGYASDLGSWDERIVELLRNVELLALEFNHDEELQKSSGRHRKIIARNLGSAGHLSNRQAAALARRVLETSDAGRLRHLVQLHLSEECNRPALALGSVRELLNDYGDTLEVHTATPDEPTSMIGLGDLPSGKSKSKGRRSRSGSEAKTDSVYVQPTFAAWDETGESRE